VLRTSLGSKEADGVLLPSWCMEYETCDSRMPWGARLVTLACHGGRELHTLSYHGGRELNTLALHGGRELCILSPSMVCESVRLLPSMTCSSNKKQVSCVIEGESCIPPIKVTLFFCFSYRKYLSWRDGTYFLFFALNCIQISAKLGHGKG